MRNLQVGPQYLLLQNTGEPALDYQFQSLVDVNGYKVAISDDLSYVAIWGWNEIEIINILSVGVAPVKKKETKFIKIYKDGHIIKSMTDLADIEVPDQLIIDNNGIMYSLLDSDVYIWNPPDYVSYLYKHINAKDISLSNGTKRYLSRPDVKSPFEVTELDTGKVFRYRKIPESTTYYEASSTPTMDLLIFQSIPPLMELGGLTIGGVQQYATLVWIVDANTQSWIDIPDSDVLKTSHSDKIIATWKWLSDDPYGEYEVNIYKREGLNFMPMAHSDSILGYPLFVSENLLLTELARTENPPNDVVIKVYKIKGQVIKSPAAYEIHIPLGKRYYLRTIQQGPNDTYIFGKTPGKSPDRNMDFFKYRIRPYDTLNEFLEAKLD